MEPKEVRQNIKLGIFVLIGLALFLAAVFLVGAENNIFTRTFTISAVFKNVEGLKPGDNVWLSGVKIGTVRNVQIVSEGRVVVSMSLRDRQNQFIRRNATASIGSDGLVGNKIVVIRPGDSAHLIHESDTINTISPADTQELINIAKDVGENTRSITDDIKVIADKLKQGQGIVGELLSEGPFASDLRSTLANLKVTGANTARASEQLNAMVRDMNRGDGLIATLINDTSFVRTFDQALTNIKRVSDNAAVMADDLGEMVSKVNDRNNALGVLLTDTTFANKMQNTLENAESASAKLDENMEALQHNFLLRGYFRRRDRREAREERDRQRQEEQQTESASQRRTE